MFAAQRARRRASRVAAGLRRNYVASPFRPAAFAAAPCPKSLRQNRKCHSGQNLLFSDSSQKRTCGWPRGRSVEARPSRFAVDSSHQRSPNGLPRCANRRIASSSPFVSGSLTRSTQFGEWGIGQGNNKRGAGSACCRQRHSEPQRQASARCTNSARRAFRSTYRHAARKCPSSWMGKLLNRP